MSALFDTKNADIIHGQMLDIKDLVLPLCRMEEDNTFSKGLGTQTKLGLTSRAKYTRTLTRDNECELGRAYYDVCELLLIALTKAFWIEPARIAALECMSSVHGVTVTGERTDRRGERIVAQDYKFQCDWRDELGIDMLVKISLKITGTAPHEMTVDYIRTKEEVPA